MKEPRAEIPKQPCEIEVSMAARMKAGSATSTVANKDKKEEKIFKLKLKGGQPKLREKKDQTLELIK